MSKEKHEAVARLFALLGLKYSNRWTSNYTDPQIRRAAILDWAQELHDIDIENLWVGLKQVTKVYPSWPPTVGEFRELCMEDQGNWEGQSHLMLEDRTAKALTQEERIAIVDKHHDSLQQALKGEYVEE